jgi:hypothetical protein
MTRFKWLVLFASIFSPILPLNGQTNDWRSVERIVPGTPISVLERGRRGCDLVQVTDSELSCDQHIGGDWRRIRFQRDRVREVRLEEPQHNKMLLGTVAGAAVGGLIGFAAGGQSSDPETRGYARVYGIPIGAVVGGLIGHAIHLHGPVVYRQP